MFEQITKFANEATTNVTDTLNENSERFASTSNQVLDTVLDVNRRIVDAAVSAADRFNEQVDVDLPFADRLPTPAAAGERYLEFVERAVSLNRDLNQRVVEMIKADNAKAASDKVVATAKSVADSATKTVTGTATTAAKKAPARKRPAKKRAAKKTAARKTTAKKTSAKKTSA
jgi:hypothetical protein